MPAVYVEKPHPTQHMLEWITDNGGSPPRSTGEWTAVDGSWKLVMVYNNVFDDKYHGSCYFLFSDSKLATLFALRWK